MTKLIGFGRCLGKTTMAILESYATGKYIISANRQMAKHTFDYAKQLGYTIHYPLTPFDLYHQGYNLISRDEGVIIDNVEMVLSSLLSRPIETITFNSRDLQFAEDRYIQEVAELKKELNACYREKEEDQQEIEQLKEKCENLLNELSGYVWDKMTLTERRKRMRRRRFAR
ncbi:hypothetical protein ACVR1I_06555 [Streptococcus cameli]